MSWQDYVFSVGGIVFSSSIVFSIRNKKEKPPKISCLITATGLTTYCFTMASLDLWLSTVVMAIQASLWWILFFQKRSISG